MKKIIIATSFLGICAYLYAQTVADYDKGYIASVKNNKCMKVADYPGKSVKPSDLLKDKSCSIFSHDETIKSMIITCEDKAAKKTIMYSYALDLEVCKESLAVQKKRGY